MADEVDPEKRLQLDIKVNSIFSKLSAEDSESWRSAKRNSDRIEIVFRNADLFHREMTVTDEKNLEEEQVRNRAHKSASEAEEMRRQGNEQFAKGRYLKAIEKYNAAVLRAPVDSDLMNICPGCSSTQMSIEGSGKNSRLRQPEDGGSKEDEDHNNDSKEVGSYTKKCSKELALALANRSAALFHLKRCEEAIRDIDWSLEFGYPRETRHKLYERRARALLQLDRGLEAERDASEAVKYLRETMPDGPGRQKHLDSLESLQRQCRGAGEMREMEERHEVGKERKSGETDKGQKGSGKLWAMTANVGARNRNNEDLEREGHGPKRFTAPHESAKSSTEAQKYSTNETKQNTCTKCKRFGDGRGCSNQANDPEDHRNISSSSDRRSENGLVTYRVAPKSEIESFSAAVKVCRSELCGRYTVSKQNFRVGKVIASMTPFAAVLYPDCYPTHCYYCFREVLLPFPCYTCSQVVYCNERCSLSAYDAYHWAECGWIGWMTFDLVGRLGHLAYRMLVEAGLENVLKVFMSTAMKDQEKGDSMGGTGRTGKSESCNDSSDADDSLEKNETRGSRSKAPNFSSAPSGLSSNTPCGGDGDIRVPCRAADYPEMMGDLVRHESRRVPCDDLECCGIAFILLQISKKVGWLSSEVRRIQATDWSRLPRDRMDLETEKAVFAALLHHIQAIQCNGFEITEMRTIAGQTGNILQRHKTHCVGIGLYPILATMNHSCDPAVDLVFYGNQAIVRAIRNIRESEEVTIDYGHLFFIQDRSTRQRSLRNTYFFDCRCLPCLKNWPLWKDLPASEAPLKCPGCGVRLRAMSVKECSSCRRVFGDELTKAVLSLEDSHHRYAETMLGMNSMSIPEAEGPEMERGVAIAEDYLSTMQERLCLPWRDFYSCQATLRQCYRMMANISSLSASD